MGIVKQRLKKLGKEDKQRQDKTSIKCGRDRTGMVISRNFILK